MEVARKLLSSGRTEAALDRLKSLIPTVDPINLWRAHELIGAAFHDLGEPDGAAQAYLNAALNDRYLRAQRRHFSNYLFALHYIPDVSNETLAHEIFNAQSLYRDVQPIQLDPTARPNNKISVGYLAPNFLQSAAARFYEPLLTHFDLNEFSVRALSLSSNADAFTNRIKNTVDEFIILDRQSIEQAAQTIATLGLDILFDLGGHSDGGITLDIMTHRPARILINGIGWLNSTGLNAFDFILTDDFLTPRGTEPLFTEKFLTVPHAISFTPTTDMLPRTRSHRSTFTLGCFNNFMKITDQFLECAAAILKRIPHSRLILQDTTRLPARRRHMLSRIQRLIPIDQINRIDVRLGHDDYLADYADVDLMLDPFPYNGGAMTATALCMNVPIVSLVGERYGARFGADILRAARLDELIVDSTQRFIERAVELSIDPIHPIDRITHSPMLAHDSFVRSVESAFKHILS